MIVASLYIFFVWGTCSSGRVRGCDNTKGLTVSSAFSRIVVLLSRPNTSWFLSDIVLHDPPTTRFKPFQNHKLISSAVWAGKIWMAVLLCHQFVCVVFINRFSLVCSSNRRTDTRQFQTVGRLMCFPKCPGGPFCGCWDQILTRKNMERRVGVKPTWSRPGLRAMAPKGMGEIALKTRGAFCSPEPYSQSWTGNLGL